MPNTIADNLHRLKATVPAIRNSITAKGGTVNAGDGLEEFAADIMSIKNDLTSIDITENGTYYSGDETVVTSSTFPVVVNDSNGTPVRHADINGNTLQNGTPTPDNPIMPEGTGERTGNLFDISKVVSNVNVTNQGDSLKIIVPSTTTGVVAGSPYTLQTYCPNLQVGDVVTLSFVSTGSSKYIYLQGENIIWSSGQSKTITSTTLSSAVVWYASGVSTEAIISNIMLNSGSTPLPYEPYGIKIPISSASTTTSVYLGEVQTTRRIKKLVLTGEEHWIKSQSRIGSMYMLLVNAIIPSLGFCDRAVNARSADEFSSSGRMLMEMVAARSFLNIWLFDTEITVVDFKTYLQQQYAAGTPVTVWYVLAESETGIVNEPLMKIWEYADSLSVDVELPLSQNAQNNIDVNTTLKPSSASFTYNKLSEYIGYNEINVDVSNTYTAEDEGKVVNNATLVSQTSMPAEITVNGTYDTTLYNSIAVNVPDIVGHTFIVATIPNAIVTVTNASNTYTETADNVGEALFKSVAAGTYNVTATYDYAVSDTTSITIADHTVTEDSFATLTISASTNTAITVTDGTVTKTLTYTGTPIVQYVSLGSWDLSCTIDDTVITRTVLVDSYTNQNIRLAPPS